MTTHEQLIRYHNLGVLDILLKDRTTKGNIIWATEAYTQFGYQKEDAINPISLLRQTFCLQSRVEKSREAQALRTKSHAEVFTPFWIVKKMNDYIDEEWFGCPGAFEVKRVPFTYEPGKCWQDYIRSPRLEITCGEAPFLTTRYDAATGESIPLAERIGILDRKLRVVNERTRSQNSWRKYARCAYQATYGYEFQGDNLLLARMNLLKTFEEYYEARWSTDPSATELKGIAKIISWNIWQMDGLTGLLPYKKPQDQYIMNGWERKKGDPGIEDECKIYDWRKNEGKKIEMFNNIKGDGCF